MGNFTELLAIMKFLIMASNRMKCEVILWRELHGTHHEFSRAVETVSTNEMVILGTCSIFLFFISADTTNEQAKHCVPSYTSHFLPGRVGGLEKWQGATR